MKILTIFIQLMLLMSGCCKEDPIPVPCDDPPCDSVPVVTGKFDIVWQTSLRQDSFNSISHTYTLWNDHVVGIDQVNKAKIAFFNKTTGTRGPLWDGQTFGSNINDALLYDNKFYFTNSIYRYVFNDIHGGEVFYKFNTDYECGALAEGFRIYNNYLYENTYDCNYRKFVNINRINLQTRQKELLYSMDTEETFGETRKCYLKKSNFWVSPQGDTNVVQFYNSIPNGQSLGKTGVFLYNINKKKVEWHNKEFTPRECANDGPIVYNDRAYMISQDSIHCIDIATGRRIWAIDDPYAVDGFKGYGINSDALPMIVDGKLYVNNSGVFMCLDAMTGQLLYGREDQDTGRSISEMTYFDGVFYYTSAGNGRLFAVRASDGKLLMEESSPNDNKPPFYDSPSFYDSGVVIDEVKRLMYVNDRHMLMCIKVPEWK